MGGVTWAQVTWDVCAQVSSVSKASVWRQVAAMETLRAHPLRWHHTFTCCPSVWSPPPSADHTLITSHAFLWRHTFSSHLISAFCWPRPYSSSHAFQWRITSTFSCWQQICFSLRNAEEFWNKLLRWIQTFAQYSVHFFIFNKSEEHFYFENIHFIKKILKIKLTFFKH